MRGEDVIAEAQLIRYPTCGATNRVSQGAREKIEGGLAPVCGRCKTQLSPDNQPVTVTDATFATDVERSPVPVVLDVWAAWCGPCRIIAPVLDELASEMAGRVRFAKQNADENCATAARFNVRSLPTLLVPKGGREVDRIIGVQPKSEVELRLTRAMTLEAASFPSRQEGYILPTDVEGNESRIYRQPVEVVGRISPWNFPLHLSNRSIAPARALGNAAVIKPASDTPVTGGLLLAKIYEEAGLPPGVLHVVVGAGSAIGERFVLHQVPRLISSIGSTKVGRQIMEQAARAAVLKRVALGLGGNPPAVILDDADLDLAVNTAVFGMFLHQGQIRMSTNRFIVDSRVHDELVEHFVARVGGLKVGNPGDVDTGIGPLIDPSQLLRPQEHSEKARAEGARQVVGGEPHGLVLPPHVFIDATNEMAIARQEQFGPVASIIKIRGEAEALEMANATSSGLSAAVVTRDVGSPVNDLPNCSFGGEQSCGVGRYNGRWAIEEFTTAHWISVQHESCPDPF